MKTTIEWGISFFDLNEEAQSNLIEVICEATGKNYAEVNEEMHIKAHGGECISVFLDEEVE